MQEGGGEHRRRHPLRRRRRKKERKKELRRETTHKDFLQAVLAGDNVNEAPGVVNGAHSKPKP